MSHVSGAVAPLPALNQRYSLSVMLMLLAALLLGFGMLNAGVKQSGYVGTSDARVALIQPSSLLATDEQQSLTPLDSGDEPQWLLALLSGLVWYCCSLPVRLFRLQYHRLPPKPGRRSVCLPCVPHPSADLSVFAA